MTDLVRQMNQAEAEAITTRIREAVESTWQLIVEAHEGQAHKALGYETWGAYVEAEFDMSRQRAYQLINHGRVIEGLEAQMSTTVDITEREARRIKPHLEEIVEDIKQGTLPQEAIRNVLIQQPKSRIAMSRQRRAMIDLKPGHIIILPHDGYSCTPNKSCALSSALHRVRADGGNNFKYVTTHTGDNFVVGCYDPQNVEALDY